MSISRILDKLNFIKECRKYHLGLWQCPSFLFVVMGLVNIIAMLGTYFIARRYDNPEIAVASVAGVSIIIFIVGSSIVKGVEQIARANIAKSEFVSIVSHQLKSPLSGMKWSLELLMGDKIGKLNGKQNSYLESIYEDTSRMVRLVNDLLDVSRIENGEIKLIPQKISLDETVRDVIQELKFFAAANNAKIEFKTENNLPWVFVDPLKIKMVIQNLIDNAIKYSKGNKKIVKVSLSQKGDFLCCRVSDSGVGIPKEEQGRIFDKFFRSDNVMKKQTVGSGLGLYIAKAVVENSGGKIGFTSKKDKGSVFWFTLPVVSEANSK